MKYVFLYFEGAHWHSKVLWIVIHVVQSVRRIQYTSRRNDSVVDFQ
jgi:hypothetical protein